MSVVPVYPFPESQTGALFPVLLAAKITIIELGKEQNVAAKGYIRMVFQAFKLDYKYNF